MKERWELYALIGHPPEGASPDEWYPRAETWHKERLNWIAEVERLRRELDAIVVICGLAGIGESGQSALERVQDLHAQLGHQIARGC